MYVYICHDGCVHQTMTAVRFGQAALHVRGKVVCLDPPCRGFEVVLEQAGKQISKSGKRYSSKSRSPCLLTRARLSET